MKAAQFVSHLGAKAKPRQTATGWKVCCPAHKDKTPSLEVSTGADGKVLLRCFAGCSFESIVAAAGLKPADLFNGEPKPLPPRTAKATPPPIDWPACLAAFTGSHAAKLAEWRGISSEFFLWLHRQGSLGIFEGKVAFPNHNEAGAVVSAHVRVADKKWNFKPSGHPVAPLIFGDVATAGFVLAFESQWDAFSVMDKLGWHTSNGLSDTAAIVTRGSSNGKLIRGRVSRDAVVYAFKQNDEPTPKQPIPPGDAWLADLAANAGCSVLHVPTPAPHKDANDWTRADATKADIEAAIASAKIAAPQAAPDPLPSNEDEPNEPQDAHPLPPIVDAADFVASPIEPPRELVRGLLHQGSKLVLGGGSKSFKTWTLLDLAHSVAYGVPWLGFETERGPVLYLNFEIQPHSWQHRIAAVARAKGITLQPGAIKLWNLRGHAADFQTLLPRVIAATKESGFALIILDPIYKLYGRTDENKAGDVAALLNGMESLAVETGAAIAFGAHFSKGNQAQKEAIDRISGSGVFARDPDSILIFTRHEQDDAFAVESILRNFSPVEAFAVRWEFPLMQRDRLLDPSKLKQAAGRKPEHSPEDLLKVLPESGLTNANWQAVANEEGISKRTFFRLRKTLEKTEKILQSKANGKWMPIQAKGKA